MARRGRQEPTFRVAEAYASTQGPLAARLADAYGMTPHPWQASVLDDWLAIGPGGCLAHDTCLLPVPRQNGKTGVSDPRETFGLIVRGEWILHTAQEFQTAKKAFDRLREKFGDHKGDQMARYPELNAMVDKYTVSANQMILDLSNGGHIEFRTRGVSSDMGRGGTFDLVVIDEAQSYTEEQDAALSPLNSAAPHGSPQTIFMGTVPTPGSTKGEIFWRQRDSAHGLEHDGMCVSEWSVGEIGDPWDVSRWYEANPSLGYQLLERGLRKDARGMTPVAFAREHLGWWPEVAPAASQPVIGEKRWAEGAVDALPSGLAAVGVRFSENGSRVDLAEARMADGGVAVMSVVVHAGTHEYGLARLADALAARASRDVGTIAVDGRSYAGALSELLRERGVPAAACRQMTTSDAVSACGMLSSSIGDGTALHVACPQLDEQMAKATKRPIGKSGGWGFAGDGADALAACAQALWALRTGRRDPTRKARIG